MTKLLTTSRIGYLGHLVTVLGTFVPLTVVPVSVQLNSSVNTILILTKLETPFFGPTIFQTNIFLEQINFRPKIPLNQNFFWTNHFWQKFSGQIIIWPKVFQTQFLFWPRIFLDPTFFGSNCFGSKNVIGLKCLGPIFF